MDVQDQITNTNILPSCLLYFLLFMSTAIYFYIFFLHILQPIQKLKKQSNECTQEVLVDPDSSSRNSLDGNWGSVSVLSTASVDVESAEKPKVNPAKPVVADCLVEPEVTDSKQEPSPKDLTKFNNESEVKKSTPLWILLGEAKSPSAKTTDHTTKKDKAVNDKEGDPMSPPKLIEDGKKGWKKVNDVRSWVPFVCCSAKSPSAKKTDHAGKKDEAVNDKDGDPMSPPKLIKDGKKGRKKVNGVRSWVPFVCCSSVNVVN